MLFRTVSAIACVAAVTAAASLAQAQTFEPYGVSFEIVDSELIVEQTQQLYCHITGFAGYVPAGGATAVIDVNPPNTLLDGDSLCDSVSLNNSNWTITPTGGTNVTITGVSVMSLLGTCAGHLYGTYFANILVIPNQGIPGTVFGFPTTCYVFGFAQLGNEDITLSGP